MVYILAGISLRLTPPAVAAAVLSLPTWAPIAAVGVVAAGALVVEGVAVNSLKSNAQALIDAAAE